MLRRTMFGLATTLAAPATAATYMPSGVQTNVALATVTGGGWSQCFASPYGGSGQSVAAIMAGCGGEGVNLMMAARLTGSDTLLLLAQAPALDVIFNTGDRNVTHNANGVDWYYSPNVSWGFAPGGSTVSRNSCDTSNTNGNQRLCWHTSGGELAGGWRAGSALGLNDSTAYERLIFTTAALPGGVPEPATWAMMLLGFGALGFTLRRKRTPTLRIRYA